VGTRIRTVKPEIVSDEKIAKLSRGAECTWYRLISQSDDYGFQLGGVRRLLGTLYPISDEVTPDVLSEWISELADAGMIRHRATVQGTPVIEIVNWSKHQKVDKPGKPILRDQIAELSGNPRETVAGDPRSRRETSDTDLGPRTMDPHARRRRRGETRETWLTPIAEAHERIYGAGSFAPLAGRFATSWKQLVDAHGGEKCARVWAFSQRDASQRKFRTPENVAARFRDFDPDAPAFPEDAPLESPADGAAA
jgi:hypothetical protein